MFPNIGVDLLHLPRLSSLLSRGYLHRFARRILTPAEQATFRRKLSDEKDNDVIRWLGVRLVTPPERHGRR
jgi:phosphopantetheinyl transferase (holo-ACP synthase)